MRLSEQKRGKFKGSEVEWKTKRLRLCHMASLLGKKTPGVFGPSLLDGAFSCILPMGMLELNIRPLCLGTGRGTQHKY